MKLGEYPVVIMPLHDADGGGFAAYAPDLPGCMSDGESQGEAVVNLQDAIECWIETATESGKPVPEPGSSVQKHRKQKSQLLKALRAAIDYSEHADGKIRDLETEIDALIAISYGSATQEKTSTLLAGFFRKLDVQTH